MPPMWRGFWKRNVILSDYVELNPRVTLPKGTIVPFVSMDVITPGTRCVYPVQERPASGSGAKFAPGDTLFARITPCLENGKIAQYAGDRPGMGSTEFFVLRAREGISDPAYVYYFAQNQDVRSAAEKSMSGASGRQRAVISSLSEFECEFPPLPVQQRIAGILSAYDELIENSQRRIKILEAMARALYREWFVHFRFPGHENQPRVASPLGEIPQGWEVKSLKDVANVTYGFPFQSKKFNTTGVGTPVIRIRNILEGSIDTFTDEVAEPKYHVKNGDILVGMDGDFHMCIWSSGHAFQNQRVAKFKSNGEIGNYHLFLALELPIQTWNKSIVGTTVAHLGDMHIKSIQIAWPPAQLLLKAREILEPMSEQITTLKRQNANLRRTRDLLLPRLLSGQIDVDALPAP